MPHFVIHCSENITQLKPASEIMLMVHEVAIASGLFAPEDIKVRIAPFEYYLVGGVKQDFIHIFGNIMEGRNESQKNDLSHMMISKLKQEFASVPILSINIRDFEKAGYCNKMMVY